MTVKYKLFDFVDNITYKKQDLFQDPEAKLDYSGYAVNKALSFYGDTVLYANELNQRPNIPKEWQFYFYLNGVPKKKRFSKWVKKDQSTKSLNIIMEYFGYTSREAQNVISLFSKELLAEIEEKLNKGGKNNDV